MDIFSQSGLQKLKSHFIKVASLKDQCFWNSSFLVFRIYIVTKAPVLGISFYFRFVLLCLYFQRTGSSENRLILMDRELRGWQCFVELFLYHKVTQFIRRNLREIFGQLFQNVIDSIKCTQIVPVTGIIHLIEYLFSLFPFVLHQLSIVDIMYPAFLKFLFKLLHPAVVIIDSFMELIGINCRFFGVKHKQKRYIPLLTVVLNLRKHIRKRNVIISKLNICLLLGKNITVFAIFIQWVNHLVKQFIIQDGVI